MGKDNNIDTNLTEEQALECHEKKKKSKKALVVLLSIFGVLLLLVLVIAFCINHYLDSMLSLISYDTGEGSVSFDETVGDEDMETSIPEAPAPDEIPPFEVIEGWYDGENIADDYEDEVINILLIGADTLDGNHARSDTMILMSVNPVKNRIVLTSFMRDSYIELPGRNYNRLNSAHAKGGPAYLIETLEYNFGIDIDNYAKVDFSSFQEAVDAIGGITLTVNDINYNYFYDWDGVDGLSKEKATDGTHTVHLDGKEALSYARTRKGHRVENSDFGRTAHQRDFLSQFVNNCKGASLSELDSLLKTLLPHVVTDIPQEELKQHLMNAITYLSYDMEDARVPCAGSYENYTTSGGAQVLNINVPANSQYVKAVIYG